MAETNSDLKKELVGFIREATAIIHYFSDIIVVISLHNVIFENTALASVIIWLMVALITAVIAEFLKSRLPTPLRIIRRNKQSIKSH